MIVLRVGAATRLPPSSPWTALPLTRTTTALLREAPPWVHRAGGEACVTDLSGPDAGTRCEPLSTRAGEFGPTEPAHFRPGRFGAQAYPHMVEHDLTSAAEYRLSFALPVRPAPGPETQTVRVWDESRLGCRWAITQVEGIRAEGPLPAEEVELFAEGASPGARIVLQRECVAGCDCSLGAGHRRPPCIVEYGESEAWLGAMLSEEGGP